TSYGGPRRSSALPRPRHRIHERRTRKCTCEADVEKELKTPPALKVVTKNHSLGGQSGRLKNPPALKAVTKHHNLNRQSGRLKGPACPQSCDKKIIVRVGSRAGEKPAVY